MVRRYIGVHDGVQVQTPCILPYEVCKESALNQARQDVSIAQMEMVGKFF